MIHDNKTGHRLSSDEIKKLVLSEFGYALICGFSKEQDPGSARENRKRFSGFMDAPTLTEYAISMNAEKPLSVETDIVELNGAQKAAFWFSMGFGNGSPLPQPSGQYNIYVNDVFCLAVRNVNYSFYWVGENSEFAFSMRRSETAPPYTGMTLSPLIENEGQAVFGIGLLVVDKSLVSDGQTARITIEPVCNYESSRYFYLSHKNDIIYRTNIWDVLDVIKHKNVKSASGYNVYFGDIHTHSGQMQGNANNKGCGRGSMEENYRYAKGPGGLHFYALTDHEWQILPDYEDTYFGLADKHNVDGEFICLKAFEHTSPVFGHRNIYFKDRGKVISNVDENGVPMHPRKLMDMLSEYDFFSIPHHTSSASHPFNTDLIYDEDKCVEIYSTWGSSEYLGDFPRGVSDRHDCYWVSDIMKSSHLLGIVASSDGHDGCPGSGQSPFPYLPHLFHFCGSGMVAVLSESLTRDNIYDAIKNRMCYATTGPPIVLDVMCGKHHMGSVIRNQKEPPIFKVSCKGTNKIKEVRVVKNGEIIHVYPCCGKFSASFDYVDMAFDGSDATYYIRVVQEDYESAWSSPFFFR